MSKPIRNSSVVELVPAPIALSSAWLPAGAELYAVLSHPLPTWTVPDTLTQSEREVVRAVLSGRNQRDVAAERGTSQSTVANQLASAFRKLGVRSRAELAAVLTNLSCDDEEC